MKTSAETKHTPEELISQINNLMEEAEALLVGPASEKVGDRIHDIQQRLKSAQARLGEIYGNARDKVVDGAKYTDKAIRSHPYESLAVALGVGVLLGALLRRNNG
jgi:ElaB/YqjD/DUF883 family membrane-anchored ribosome-binding protein